MITVPEAARHIGRNPETIRRWIRSGRLRSTQVGTQHLLDESDLAVVADIGVELPPGWQPEPDLAGVDWARAVRDVRDR